MKRSIQVLCAAFAAGSLVLVAAPAAAQSSRLPSSDWRQTDRVDATKGRGSPQNFTFELRFGAYSPDIDSEFGGGATPYADVFNTNPQFYFGLEFDYLPLRIPYVGAFGLGLGWGWTHTSTTAKTESGAESAEETSLTIMPMHASAVLRLDELMRRTGVPIVPYGKFGFGLGLWKSEDGDEIATSTRTNPDGTTQIVEAKGNTTGLHMALGGMLSLDFIDPRAAARLDDSTGVNHAYIFGEWMNANLNGFGQSGQLRVGSSTWVLGLAIDM
uniref:Secreted protein n=1 Tax=Phaselicystis flava TaxID=525924 RepID=A0A3S5GYH5_9BACT|nr:secreted protein [Phaselicystis flava]